MPAATEGYTAPAVVIAVLGLVVSVVGGVYTWWKNRQNGEVATAAREATLRSEEALSIAKAAASLAHNWDKRDAARFEAEEAKGRAPTLAARWESELLSRRNQGPHLLGRESVGFTLEVTDLAAAPFAVDIVRARAKELWLVEVHLSADKRTVNLSGYTLTGARGRGLTK